MRSVVRDELDRRGGRPRARLPVCLPEPRRAGRPLRRPGLPLRPSSTL